MSEVLDQIEARYYAIDVAAAPGKSDGGFLGALSDCTGAVPRLLAAVRAVEQAMDDLDDARARGIVWTYGEIQYRVRNALTDALGGKDRE